MPRLLKVLAVWIVVAAAGWASLHPAAAYSACPDITAAAGNSCVPVTAWNQGTTAAVVAQLPAAAGKTTYICGFTIDSTATVATNGTASVSNLVVGPFNILQGVGLAPAVASLFRHFDPCIPASAPNLLISVQSAASGAGGIVTVNVWGYQQ